MIGAGEAQERGIVGETPNLAGRLQAIAEPDTVVLAEGTRKLLGNLFELHDLGASQLKGIAEPVRAWAALRASAVESRFEALRTATTPLVGRDEEMALLMRHWEQAKAGEGQIVLVCGEPGIGKSRLAQTMAEQLAGEPHIRLRFFCSPHHQDSALYPIIAHLERAAGFRREDTTEHRLDKLEALLAQGTNDVSAVAPLLADLLAVPTGERYPTINLTPQKRKEKTLAALTAQVEGLSAREPVLMVYEDVHWSDPTTRESLDLLVDRLSGRRVLAIITFRPEFSPPWIGRPQRYDGDAQPASAAAARGDDRACDRRQGAAQGDRRADCRPYRRCSAVHRGIDQVGGGERPGHGRRRQLRGDRACCAAGNPDHAARFATRATRPAGADAGGGADRRRAWSLVLARADQRRRSDAAALDWTMRWSSWSPPS